MKSRILSVLLIVAMLLSTFPSVAFATQENSAAEPSEPTEPCEHNWDDGTGILDATCTSSAVITYTCTLCGETSQEIIEPLGHSYVNGYCSLCGDAEVTAFALTDQIADGDEIIIYSPSTGLVLGANASNASLAGIAASPVDGRIEAPEGTAAMTVSFSDDEKFTLQTADGKFLTSAPIGNGLSFTDTANECSEWKLQPKEGTALFYIYNVGANYNDNYNQALEVYVGNFTTYGCKELEMYEFELYVRGGEPICAHVWDDGELVVEPSCIKEGEFYYNCTLCGEIKVELLPVIDCVDDDGNDECDLCGKIIRGKLTEVAFTDLSEGDAVVVVMHAPATGKDYVLLNNFATTPANNSAEFNGTHNVTMRWIVTMIDGAMKLCPYGSSDFLYAVAANNGLKVGKEDAGAIGFDATNGYLTILDLKGETRYIGVYDNVSGDTSAVTNPNFRCYKLTAEGAIHATIASQSTTIYRLDGKTEPSEEPTEPSEESTEPSEEPTEPSEEPTEADDIVIFYTNDVHTYIDKNLSYDTVAALKAESVAAGNDTLLVDAGDHAQGTAYGSMDKGEHIIALMNAAGYDYATLGNHEFDYGMDGAMNIIDKPEYKYLSANFYHERDGVRGENVLDAYSIVELEGRKVAIIGITTPETFTKSTPAYFQDENGNYIYGIAGGVDGADLYADVQAAIDAAKAEGAEIVIALGHLGDDPASDPWNSEDVIENTTGLDAFIDGHSHSTVVRKEVVDKEGNIVVLTQAIEYFDAIGKMTIKADGTISNELIIESAASDAAVSEAVEAWKTEVDTLLETVIAKNEIDFRIKNDEGTRLIRSQETNLGDFTADALYYLFDNMDMDVDVAIMNGGGIRANMPVGDVSYKTTKNVHTFGNVACLQTITGQQLLDALEWGAKNVGVGENGGFLQVSGITYEIHSYIEPTVQADDWSVWCGAPTGEYRVKNVKVAGEDLDLSATYNLAGYNYTLRDLGDGFAMFDGAVNILDYVMEDYFVLANYAKSFPEATIKADNSVLGANYGDINGEGRITIVAGQDIDGTVAIYNDANKKVMTTEISVYTSSSGATKDQFVAVDALVNAEGKISTDAENVALFNVENLDGGKVAFVTEDGKYLFCDGTNMALVPATGEFTEFILDPVEGGYYIRLANFLYNGTSAQYLEYYKDTITCYGINANSDLSIFTFTLREKAETVCTHVWNDGEVAIDATCTESGVYAYTCTLCGAIVEEEIAPLGHSYVDDVCTVCGAAKGETFVLTNEILEGDQIIIYYPAGGKVLSTTASGTRLAGVDATPIDGTIEAPEGAAAMTVSYIDGEKFTLQTADGKFLTSAPTGNGLSFEDTANECSEWKLQLKEGTAIFYIFNVGANFNGNYNQALEYYNAFTTYGHKETEIYEFEIYAKGKDGICIHSWDEGNMTSVPTCMAEGEIFYTCTQCGEIRVEIIPATDCVDEDGNLKCDLCGRILGGELTEVAFADLADGDTIVIVVHASAEATDLDYVLLNGFTDDAIGGSAQVYEGTHDETMYWTVSVVDGVMKLCPNGSSDFLYCKNANNGLKVGKDLNGDIGFDAENGYLTILDMKGNTRYIGIYDKIGSAPVPYFRSYKLTAEGALHADIANQTTTIYKLG